MAKAPDDNKVLTDVDNLFRIIDDPTRAVLERTWFRNILYFVGEQWLSWFNEQNTFGRRYELHTDMPTPVSNMIRDYVRSMIALTMNRKYTTTVWPNSDEQDDKDAAELGANLLDWMDSLDCGHIDDVKEAVEMWRILTGSGFCRTFPCDDNGMYVVDKSGNVVVNKGEIINECIIPFNLVVPPLGAYLRDKMCVGIKSLKEREWVEDTFKVKLQTEGQEDVINYQRQLMSLVANVSPWKGRGIEEDLTQKSGEDLVMYFEVEYKPTKEYPAGRYVSKAGNKVLVNDTKMPIPVGKDGSWDYTATHFAYNRTPGAFWASSGVDDLISPQNTINHIDQALEVNRDSLGHPYVLTPSDVVVKRISSRNQGLLSISYDATLAMGARPVVQPGTPYPDQILKERDIQVGVHQDAGGNPKSILQGHSPHSGASGIMVDILRETAESVHLPDTKRFYRAWGRVDHKRLVLAQSMFKETRMLKIRGKGNEITVKKFKGSDLRGNFDVRLELDSGLSSTQAGKTARIVELVQAGFWGDVSERPQVQRELMKRLGMGGFPEEDNLHRARAEYENSCLTAKTFDDIAFPGIPKEIQENPETGEPVVMSWEIPPVIDPVFRIDNHLVHMQVHDQLILSREFKKLSEECQARAVAHRVMHEQAWQEQVMEEAMRQQSEEDQKISGGGGSTPSTTLGGIQ